MIRPATLADLDAILFMTKHESVAYPNLRFDEAKVRKVLVNIISSAKHFCWISHSESKNVTGAIIATTNENLWAQRQSSNVVFWLSQIPGDGTKLLIAFRDWIKSRRAVKVAGFAPDNDRVDPRVWKLASILGFKRYGGAYLLYN